ncbi:MAG: hypothetical protein QFX33_00010 [Candidatus Nezhaarchaeota archaeon]|nr:hypothetical protein [Candidatus Nezhaarchaeota archaeon]
MKERSWVKLLLASAFFAAALAAAANLKPPGPRPADGLGALSEALEVKSFRLLVAHLPAAKLLPDSVSSFEDVQLAHARSSARRCGVYVPLRGGKPAWQLVEDPERGKVLAGSGSFTVTLDEGHKDLNTYDKLEVWLKVNPRAEGVLEAVTLDVAGLGELTVKPEKFGEWVKVEGLLRGAKPASARSSFIVVSLYPQPAWAAELDPLLQLDGLQLFREGGAVNLLYFEASTPKAVEVNGSRCTVEGERLILRSQDGSKLYELAGAAGYEGYCMPPIFNLGEKVIAEVELPLCRREGGSYAWTGGCLRLRAEATVEEAR